ncbi:MAG: DMT family transporter [Flavisolibacter sp.]
MHFCNAMGKQNFNSWFLFILLSLIWGSSFILMKESAKQLTGIQIGAIRIFAAGVSFLPFAIFHIRKIPGKKFLPVILSGLLGNLIPAFLFATAIHDNGESSLASILNSLTPLFVILIGILFFKAKIHAKKITGVLVGFIGLLILGVSKGRAGADTGLIMILIATVCYGITVNIVSYYLKGIDGLTIAAVSLTFMAIPAGIVLWTQNVFSMVRYDPEARLSIAIAALLGITSSAIATAFFYILIQKAGALFASLVTYAIPVVAIMWGLLANENISALQFGALAVILGGVYLANR